MVIVKQWHKQIQDLEGFEFGKVLGVHVCVGREEGGSCWVEFFSNDS